MQLPLRRYVRYYRIWRGPSTWRPPIAERKLRGSRMMCPRWSARTRRAQMTVRIGHPSGQIDRAILGKYHGIPSRDIIYENLKCIIQIIIVNFYISSRIWILSIYFPIFFPFFLFFQQQNSRFSSPYRTFMNIGVTHYDTALCCKF